MSIQNHLFCSLFALCFVALTPLAHGAQADDLPGWRGETHKIDSADLNFGGKSKIRGQNVDIIDPTKILQLSWKPRAFLYKGFLTNEECDHLVDLAKDKVEPSTVVDDINGKSVLSDYRSSYGTFLSKAQDDIVGRIEKRIAAWTFLPKENGEELQILRYNYGQKYDAHFDYFEDKLNSEPGGHRYATVLMYLSNVEMGGETVFPNAEDTTAKDSSWSDCGKKGLAVKPVKGDALLFFSLKPDATPDELSLHSGCPVLHGTKWSATKWIHVADFENKYIPNGCTDTHPNCPDWAAIGECEKNVLYMVGQGEVPGNCRKSCKVC